MNIVFNFDTLKWEGITVEMVKFWESAYKDLDVVDILMKKIPAWMMVNGARAHKKNYGRFIVNWLSREQQRYDQKRYDHFKVEGGGDDKVE